MQPPHFEYFRDWPAARERLGFDLAVPQETLGYALSSLALFARDHHLREVAPGAQSLEAHYGAFVFSQSRPGREEALRRLREMAYGATPREGRIGEAEARFYERGPEPEPGDCDPRMPAVVVWAPADRFHLVGSDQLELDVLLRIARSVA